MQAHFSCKKKIETITIAAILPIYLWTLPLFSEIPKFRLNPEYNPTPYFFYFGVATSTYNRECLPVSGEFILIIFPCKFIALDAVVYTTASILGGGLLLHIALLCAENALKT